MDIPELPAPAPPDTIDVPSAIARLNALTPQDWAKLLDLAAEGATTAEVAHELGVSERDIHHAANSSEALRRILDRLSTAAKADASRKARAHISTKNGGFNDRAYNATLRNIGEDPTETVVHVHAVAAPGSAESQQILDLTGFYKRMASFAPELLKDNPFTAEDNIAQAEDLVPDMDPSARLRAEDLI